jgi:hypothetical protein
VDIQNYNIKGYDDALDIWVGISVFIVPEASNGVKEVKDSAGNATNTIICNEIMVAYLWFRKTYGKDMKWIQVIDADGKVRIDTLKIQSDVFKMMHK